MMLTGLGIADPYTYMWADYGLPIRDPFGEDVTDASSSSSDEEAPKGHSAQASVTRVSSYGLNNV